MKKAFSIISPLLGDVAKAGIKPLLGKPVAAGAGVAIIMPNPHIGIQQASQYLREMGLSHTKRNLKFSG